MVSDKIKQKAIIYDIDGFVCDSSERLKKYNNPETIQKWGKMRWKYFSQTTAGDIPINIAIDIIKSNYINYQEYAHLWVTSRNEWARIPTLNWLQENIHPNIQNELLFMRHKDDHDFCAELKRKVVRNLKDKYDIICAYDDNVEICNMYVEEGIPAFHFMAPGIDCVKLSGEMTNEPS